MNTSNSLAENRRFVSAVFAMNFAVLGAYAGANALTKFNFLPRWFTFWIGFLVGFVLVVAPLYFGFQKILQAIEKRKVKARNDEDANGKGVRHL